MLSLVAGPVDIVPLDPLEAHVLVTSGIHAAVWIDGLGLAVIADTGSSHVGDVYLVQLDGHAVRLGALPNTSTFGWSVPARAPVMASVWGWREVRLPPAAPLSLHASDGITSFGVMPDRRIDYLVSITHHGLDSSSGSPEYAFASPPATSGSWGLVYAGEKGGHHFWWCIDTGTGHVLRYDATAKTEDTSVARTGFGGGIHACGYSVKHDLFMVVRRDTARTPNVDQLYVYANEPVAASISAPAFTEAPRRGGRSQLRARVLGDLGEPCAGRAVTFEVSAGTLEAATVETDVAGYATTYYQGPTGSAPSGATATATLEE